MHPNQLKLHHLRTLPALVGNWASDVADVTGDVLQVATKQSGGVNVNPYFLPKITRVANKLNEIFKKNYIFYLENGYIDFNH